MKTLLDLEKMKDDPVVPFENAYKHMIIRLADYYISKSNGIERIGVELKDWDEEAKKAIISEVITEIEVTGIMDFNSKELWDLIK